MDKQLKRELAKLDKKFRAGLLNMLEWQTLKDEAFTAARLREQSLAKTILATGPL
jgi:hypothetical protein